MSLPSCVAEQPWRTDFTEMKRLLIRHPNLEIDGLAQVTLATRKSYPPEMMEVLRRLCFTLLQ
jgi:hypothetical protein